MANNPRDSQRKNEFIIGHRILIDIYDRDNEISGEVNRKII